MTNLKDAPQSLPQETNGNGNGHSTPQNVPQTEAKKTPKKGLGLRTQLLSNILPTVLIPLVVAGGAGWWIVHDNIQTRWRDQLQRNTLLAGEAMNQLLSDFLPLPRAVGNNPIITDAMREANEIVTTEELNSKSITVLEEQFNENRVLNLDSQLNRYLRDFSSDHGISEVIVTQKDGFNIAYNQRTSDFVQRDEQWWQQAREQRQFLGELQYDESTGTRQIPLTQAIQDPDTGEFLGVVRIGMPTTAFEVVEKYLEQSGILETGEVQIINTSEDQVFVTVTEEGSVPTTETNGGEAVEAVARGMVENVNQEGEIAEENLSAIAADYDLEQSQVREQVTGLIRQEV